MNLKDKPDIWGKILFETNENSCSNEVNEIIELYCSIGYKLQSRGYDTILIL